MTQYFFIPGKFPSLNEALAAKRQQRGRGDGYAALKKAWEERIIVFARQSGITPVESARFGFHFCELNRRRDPDNFTTLARKFILDALVRGELIPNDGWDVVLGFRDSWEVASKCGVGVTIEGEAHATE